MDFMVQDWTAQVNYTGSKLKWNFNQVRGDVISTHQPYRADEKWESTYVCQADQFVVLKFDLMEFSKIAIDILRIQLLTAEESKYQRHSVFLLLLSI